MKTLLQERRAQLVELLGEERVVQMEKLFDDYVIYGVRRGPDDPPLVGLFSTEPDTSETVQKRMMEMDRNIGRESGSFKDS